MAKSKMNPKAEFFFLKNSQWQDAYEKLRAIALECGLTEDLKWGCPCYTLGDKNVVLIHGFKEYCAYLFFKGAIMPDPDGILVQQTKNVQSARQVRFTSAAEVAKMKTILKRYIKEAARLEESGAKVEFKKTTAFEMPEEFQHRLGKNAALKKAFAALTPGRQRAYLLYFSSAKQTKTRESRIEKYIPHILKGKGLDD